ncbi:P-loop NTPase family protein [Gorillibacterium timonense]|uniref:hypothetical protein n=1 Tax=Gorillibacterium timonense TaxID=1689269 RepID=UPI0011DCE40B|nr:hypothetical protein [Gorillibacterium timonense]
MRPLRLGILEDDREYLEPLKAFFRSGDVAKSHTLVAFTKANAVKSHCAESGKLDILLIGTTYRNEAASLVEFASFCCEIGEGDSVIGNAALDIPFIAKYQPLDQLMAVLKQMTSTERIAKSIEIDKASEGRVIAVYSASGGCGKSMTAWNLANGLAYFGSKTLLLSLEAIPSELPFGSPSGEDRFGKLLYYLKADPASLSTRMKGLTQFDPRSGLAYLEPPSYSGDLDCLSREDTQTLITSLKSGGFDYVILDLSSSLDERTAASLTECDLILWLVTDDIGCLSKTDKALREWEKRLTASIRDKAMLGINRYTGTLSNRIEPGGLTPDFYLPYLPEWKSLSSMSQLLSDSSIQDTLIMAVTGFFADKEALVRA